MLTGRRFAALVIPILMLCLATCSPGDRPLSEHTAGALTLQTLAHHVAEERGWTVEWPAIAAAIDVVGPIHRLGITAVRVRLRLDVQSVSVRARRYVEVRPEPSSPFWEVRSVRVIPVEELRGVSQRPKLSHVCGPTPTGIEQVAQRLIPAAGVGDGFDA